MNKVLLALFFAICVGCSETSQDSLDPSGFIALHLTSVDNEKRHEDRLRAQLLSSYGQALSINPDAVREGLLPVREEFESRIERMKNGFDSELDDIASKMEEGDRFYYYEKETERGAEFGYLITRKGRIVFKSGSEGIVWDKLLLRD